MIIIESCDPFDPGPRALLEQSHALMEELFEPEESFSLGSEVLGTGAVVQTGSSRAFAGLRGSRAPVGPAVIAA